MAKAEYRSAIRSRKMINAALADLLQEKPLDKITVSDVVRRAEINRGTFYAHYTDIPDVINHLIQQTFSSIQDAFSNQSVPITEIPGLMLLRIQKMLEEDLDFIRKVMNSSAASLMQEQLVYIVSEYMIQNVSIWGVEDRERFALTVRFCAGGLSNLYRDWFSGKLEISLDELTTYATDMLQTMVRKI